MQHIPNQISFQKWFENEQITPMTIGKNLGSNILPCFMTLISLDFSSPLAPKLPNTWVGWSRCNAHWLWFSRGTFCIGIIFLLLPLPFAVVSLFSCNLWSLFLCPFHHYFLCTFSYYLLLSCPPVYLLSTPLHSPILSFTMHHSPVLSAFLPYYLSHHHPFLSLFPRCF